RPDRERGPHDPPDRLRRLRPGLDEDVVDEALHDQHPDRLRGAVDRAHDDYDDDAPHVGPRELVHAEQDTDLRASAAARQPEEHGTDEQEQGEAQRDVPEHQLADFPAARFDMDAYDAADDLGVAHFHQHPEASVRPVDGR